MKSNKLKKNKHKNKKRKIITLQCDSCIEKSLYNKKRTSGITYYKTTKNIKTTTFQLKLKKHCSKCNKHCIFNEIH
uniref:Ribosomal protein L33 n=1 Tax=Spumella sp. NIES-1846 TaxID=2490549 RepID=A0A455REU3_9STRA|nr:ribosomal protein L33 [Spumella sp. NIES-1846]